MISYSVKKQLLVIIAFAVLTFILYYPILNNEFLSDDFDSLYRIVIEKRILFKGLLRPLMDISFSLNYLISGLHTWSYYTFNLILHVINAFLLYRLVLSYPIFKDRRQEMLALISGFLFIIYPFHNEAIVWLTGRLASMASFFALITLNIWLSKMQIRLKFFICLLLYFIGLLAYESIVFLPVVAIILGLERRSVLTRLRNNLLGAVGVIAFLLLIRFVISGTIYGDYGSRLVTSGWDKYVLKAFKTLGRSFFPPSEHTNILTIVFLLFLCFIVWIHFKLFKMYRSKTEITFQYLKIIACFLVSILIPMLFGISTRTSEGDRLLYFPSLFLCPALSLVIMLVAKPILQRICFSVLFTYFIYFLIQNNRQWEKASNAVSQVLQATENSKGKPVYLINIPDELEGAYVFRNGFERSLKLYKIDTSKVFFVNNLTRLEYLKIGGLIPVKKNGEMLMIPPFIQIEDKNDSLLEMKNFKEERSFLINKSKSLIYYWNKSELLQVL